jgi:hypothetical protein
LYDVFAAHFLGRGEPFRRAARVDHRLSLPGSVAQIDEDDTAHITSSIDPPRKRDSLADMIAAQLAATMRFQHTNPSWIINLEFSSVPGEEQLEIVTCRKMRAKMASLLQL